MIMTAVTAVPAGGAEAETAATTVSAATWIAAGPRGCGDTALKKQGPVVQTLCKPDPIQF